jgi:protein ImuB
MFVCLFVPDFSVQAALRIEPDSRERLQHSPIVVLDGHANLFRVFAANSMARSLGIKTGMTKLQVETCGGVLIKKRVLAHEDAAQAALLDCAGEFSPRVESTFAGAVILDLQGTERLFGRSESIARKIAARAADFGFELQIAVASNPDTAFYVARGFKDITIVPAGDEARQLASLPLKVLPISAELLEVLEGWGIHTCKSFTALPPIQIVERLGQEGFQLWNLARGKTNRPLVPTEPFRDFIESYEFEEPVGALEPITFILNRLIQQLCTALQSRALGTHELRLRLDLEVRQVKQVKKESQEERYERTWKLPLPIQDGKVLFRLAHLELEGNTFSAPIKRITVQVVPVKTRPAQSGLFAPTAPETERLEITLARIRGVVGSSDQNGIACMGSPKLLDTHKPDSFTVEAFSGLIDKTDSFRACTPVLSLRVFRPALETSVESASGKLCSISLGKRRLHVLAAFGPWHSSGNWWTPSAAWAREEWDVALKTSEGIGYYRIYQDRIRQQWFVEGIFD